MSADELRDRLVKKHTAGHHHLAKAAVDHMAAQHKASEALNQEQQAEAKARRKAHREQLRNQAVAHLKLASTEIKSAFQLIRNCSGEKAGVNEETLLKPILSELEAFKGLKMEES